MKRIPDPSTRRLLRDKGMNFNAIPSATTYRSNHDVFDIIFFPDRWEEHKPHSRGRYSMNGAPTRTTVAL